MRWLFGQAARLFGWAAHHLAQLALAMVIVFALLVGGVAWRLSKGPLESAWLARVLERAADPADRSVTVTIGHAAIAWSGWRDGSGVPFTIGLADVSAKTSTGKEVARLDVANFALSFGRLLEGKLVPRLVEATGLHLDLVRNADGSIAMGPFAGSADNSAAEDKSIEGVMRETAKPAQTDRDRSRGDAFASLAQLRRVRISNASISIADVGLGTSWVVPRIDADLRRRGDGGVEGEAGLEATIADHTLHLAATAKPAGNDGSSAVALTMDTFNPSEYARLAPSLAPLAQFDAKLAVTANATLDAALRPRDGQLHVIAGAGRAKIAKGEMPFLGIALDAHGDRAGSFEAKLTKFELAARPDGPHTTITGTAAAQRVGKQYTVEVAVDLDHAAFADLPILWPNGLGGPGTQPWITKNIVAGTAHDLHVKAKLKVADDFSDAEAVSVSGGAEGSDVTAYWLRPVPPIEHGEVRLTFLDPDTIDVAVTSGRQRVTAQGTGIAVSHGDVRLTGIAGKDQFADIETDLAGTVPDLLAILKNPRIKLLDKRPMPMKDPSGKFAGHLTVAHLPLKDAVSMDDLQIHAKTHFDDTHLGGIAAGRDLDHAMLDLEASNDGLHVQGKAQVAAIPLDLVVDMDFRTGPPTQTVMKVTASGTADEKQLAAGGLDAGGIVAGPVGLKLDYASQRGGAGDVTLHADLSRTSVAIERAGIRKQAGAAAVADAHVRLDHDRLASIESIHIEGAGILVDGTAEVADGRPNVLHLATVRLGTTTDFHGDVTLPAKPGDAYAVTVAGPSLDLSGQFGGRRTKKSEATQDDKPGPPYLIDASFDRILMARGSSFTGVSAQVENDGRMIRRAAITGSSGPRLPFRLRIEPAGSARRLTADVADVGSILQGTDTLAEINGGHLTLSGSFDDRRADHALTANADIEEFRVRGEAALGKILQGMTLYGLVDVLSGPGLNFTRLIAPVRYADGVVTLQDARAFSSSLGMTAKGTVDTARRTLDVEGTVVPAYFLNSLLGKIPLLGTVFSPERGGGVFAATYSVRGPLDNPSVGINPLAALTPGFLRGLFGVFDK